MDTTVIELKAYPFPEGMAIPRLMPFQEYPWNGDHHLAAEVLRLKEAHGLKDAIETGTCLGSTTCWLAGNFAHVLSFEINEVFATIARERLDMLPKAHSKIMAAVITGNSVDVLKGNLKDTFIFLDAHPMSGTGEEGYATVLKELEAIAEAKVKPCIVLHDFQVPGLPEAGWDTYNGQPFTLEWIIPYLDRIYGEGKWKHNYPTEVAGAKRGWVSVFPA